MNDDDWLGMYPIESTEGQVAAIVLSYSTLAHRIGVSRDYVNRCLNSSRSFRSNAFSIH